MRGKFVVICYVSSLGKILLVCSSSSSKSRAVRVCVCFPKIGSDFVNVRYISLAHMHVFNCWRGTKRTKCPPNGGPVSDVLGRTAACIESCVLIEDEPEVRF